MMYNVYMSQMLKILKGIFITMYIFLLVYVSIFYIQIGNYLNLEQNAMLVFIVCNIFILGIYYTSLLFKINKMEFEFTSIVNHVFRTPLTRIMWIAKELKRNDLNREEKDTYLQNLENATTRVIDIVDIIAGIKDINSTQGYFFQAVYIREIFEKSIAKYKKEIEQKNISFSLMPFKDIPLLTVDLKKISFVIDVLIENAVLYTQKNGSIKIEPKVKNDKIIISINDDGIGIGFVEKMRIFSKFYRGQRAKHMHTDGMGLGLYLSRIIVKRHRGRIYAHSKGVGKGSTFFIKLPFSR